MIFWRKIRREAGVEDIIEGLDWSIYLRSNPKCSDAHAHNFWLVPDNLSLRYTDECRFTGVSVSSPLSIYLSRSPNVSFQEKAMPRSAFSRHNANAIWVKWNISAVDEVFIDYGARKVLQ